MSDIYIPEQSDIYSNFPTPTPFWDASGTPSAPLITAEGTGDIMVNSFVSGYNFVEQAALFQFGMWFWVVLVVYSAFWTLSKHWTKVMGAGNNT